MKRWRIALTRGFSVLVLGACLSACSSLPNQALDVLPTAAERPTGPVSALDYRFSGRLLLKQGVRQDIVGLSWHHQADQDELLFTNPLGQGLAELTRNTQGARLQLADQRVFQAADWQQLARQLFAIELPLDALSEWLLGVAPVGVQTQHDELGRLQRLITTHWQVDYLDYASAEANALPVLLEVHHRQQTPDAFKLRLKIDHWQLGQPGDPLP